MMGLKVLGSKMSLEVSQALNTIVVLVDVWGVDSRTLLFMTEERARAISPSTLGIEFERQVLGIVLCSLSGIRLGRGERGDDSRSCLQRG
jgi:hypothetical protein